MTLHLIPSKFPIFPVYGQVAGQSSLLKLTLCMCLDWRVQIWNVRLHNCQPLKNLTGTEFQQNPLAENFFGTKSFGLSSFFVYFLWEEGFRRLAEWRTWIKGPWHGWGAERHNLLQLCRQRPWISLFPDRQVRLGSNGIMVKTKITFFAFRKYLFYFLRDIACEHCAETNLP